MFGLTTCLKNSHLLQRIIGIWFATDSDMSNQKSLTDAASLIQSGARVFVQGGAATPNALLAEITRQADRFTDLTFIHLHTEGPAHYAEPKYKNKFRVVNLFVGKNMRPHLDYDRNDYLPCFLSEIPALIRSQKLLLDVALIHVSLPDRHGYCSLGVSVDIVKAAMNAAPVVIAQINPKMPRVHGDGFVHMTDFTAWVSVDEVLPQSKVTAVTETEIAIGKNVASLIDDRSTLQLGIGSIPNAVSLQLRNHKDLGVHSEMWSDGVMELMKCGAVTNAFKKVHQGKTVSGFLMGSTALYEFVDDNPSVLQLEIDLTGQVCADSIGSKIISGVGGQMDFMRGAALSMGGKPIIALPSRTRNGQARIVAQLKLGAGVVTTRSHVHYVVTEFGIAILNGKTLSERARALISIAHPDDREILARSI